MSFTRLGPRLFGGGIFGRELTPRLNQIDDVLSSCHVYIKKTAGCFLSDKRRLDGQRRETAGNTITRSESFNSGRMQRHAFPRCGLVPSTLSGRLLRLIGLKGSPFSCGRWRSPERRSYPYFLPESNLHPVGWLSRQERFKQRASETPIAGFLTPLLRPTMLMKKSSQPASIC